jgi:2-hydroxycyclohexanecarboxyl-CoA dehydrogenase
MDLGLAGKTVIVTGGGSNIGRAIFLTFVKEGANVVCAELDEKQGQKVVGEANALGGGGRAILVKTNVTNWDSVQATVKKTLEEFGKIDVLANVVGWTFDRLFIEKPREEWEKEINLNLWSVINCTRAVVDHMMERKYGKIVSMGSDAGRMGEFREAVYGACKGGVIALSKALAREMGRYNINVNVVCPGMVIPETAEHAGKMSMSKDLGGGMTHETIPQEMKEKVIKNYALRRICTPQEVANAVVFLASDAASFITGQTLSVSGGYTMM